MPETHSPARPNTLKVRAGRILIGVGAVGFAYLANEQSIEPQVATIEAATNVDALTLGSPRDLDSFAITPEPAAIAKREPKVSRSKERTEPKVEVSTDCSTIENSELKYLKSKKSLANVALACEMIVDKGWFSEQEMVCLTYLWRKESGWRANADNSDSSAYGIPQALPGNKMRSAGKDWATNPATQIEWGLGYIKGRYGTPCDASDAFNSKGWY